ncbi:hypothetical protein SAMN05216262_110118 [Colwellia chukchiensis]|uniref:Uncharacterized protein n=1 Tax=Colwellia chukchiensis TaxID=641665 RepID=A0A1H7Q2I7_9GAMM|nr:hypothetical protein [Colwellia chukchiensis]SEL41904.1 hypothetical protein SAMN05216262_110118 [Colwellia chukchiensis]
MKQFSAIQTLKIMLERPNIMFNLIKKMDAQNERFISEGAVAFEVLESIKHLDKLEQQRFKIAYATDNLAKSHIVADQDQVDNVSRLMFQESVVSIFRLCETSLYQELTDAKLKAELASFWHIQKKLLSGDCSFNSMDYDYTELVDELFHKLGSLLDLLKRNLVRMQSINSDLEKLSFEVSKDGTDFVEYRQKVLDDVTHLYERHILPTQRFVNPDVKLVDGDNLLATINSIKLLFDAHGKHELSDQVFRYGLSFTNIINPLKDVSNKINGFIRKTQKSLTQFNAMEWHFERFKKKYEETLDGRVNRTKIDNSFADDVPFMKNVKRIPRPKGLKIENNSSYFYNIFKDLEYRIQDQLLLSNEDIEAEGQALVSFTSKDRLKRAKAIYDLIEKLSLRESKDVIATLHYRLQSLLPEYHFVDLINAVVHFMKKTLDGKRLIKTNNKAFIQQENKYYVYRIVILQESN